MRIEIVPGSRTTELRRAVLRPAWAAGTAMPGDADPDAVHVAALDRDAVVGTCVLFAQSCPHHQDVHDAWQLRGMATASERRGQGIGALVLAAALGIVRERQGSLIWCKARLGAVGFYTAHGYRIDSDEYLEPQTGLTHRDLSRAV